MVLIFHSGVLKDSFGTKDIECKSAESLQKVAFYCFKLLKGNEGKEAVSWFLHIHFIISSIYVEEIERHKKKPKS
jgi:hypothetical protein